MVDLRLHVHERMDETIAVSFVPLSGRSMPRAWGDFTTLGVCQMPSNALSHWVRQALDNEGYCAVAGQDAQAVLQAVAEMKGGGELANPTVTTSLAQSMGVG